MKKIFIALLIFFTIVCTNTAQSQTKIVAVTKNQSEVKKQLLALEYKSLVAEFALDTAFLSSIIDITILEISEEGMHNKQQYLSGMYNNISQRIKDSLFVDSFKLEEAIVNLYGNTAVVTFVVHTYRKTKGVRNERRTRFYDVWINDKRKWKLVATQGTPVKE